TAPSAYTATRAETTRTAAWAKALQAPSGCADKRFMATTEPGISPPATTSEVGRHLRTVRKAQGLSRSEVARSAGITRRELAAYERGRIPVPDSDLWCLAGSCGVDVSELLPSRDKLVANSALGSLTVGDSVARLRAGATAD